MRRAESFMLMMVSVVDVGSSGEEECQSIVWLGGGQVYLLYPFPLINFPWLIA